MLVQPMTACVIFELYYNVACAQFSNLLFIKCMSIFLLAFVPAWSRIFHRELFYFSHSIKNKNIPTPKFNMETVGKETLNWFLIYFCIFWYICFSLSYLIFLFVNYRYVDFECIAIPWAVKNWVTISLDTSGELKDHLSGEGQIVFSNSIKTISFFFSLQNVSNNVLSKVKSMTMQ